MADVNIVLVPHVMLSRPGSGLARVHAGFAHALSNLKDTGLMGAIERCAGEAPHIIVTGHSLGGAIAILLGVELARTTHCIVSVITFGAPQVGNDAFAHVCDDSTRLRITRVENTADIVSKMPSAMAMASILPICSAYRHPGAELRLDYGAARVNQIAMQYLDRATQALANGADDWLGVMRGTSAHSLAAYRANRASLSQNSMQRLVMHGARTASWAVSG